MAKGSSCYLPKQTLIREESLNAANNRSFGENLSGLKEEQRRIFTRIYHMLRPDIYFPAYKNLYSNNGAATPGIDEDTADGFRPKRNCHTALEAITKGFNGVTWFVWGISKVVLTTSTSTS